MLNVHLQAAVSFYDAWEANTWPLRHIALWTPTSYPRIRRNGPFYRARAGGYQDNGPGARGLKYLADTRKLRTAGWMSAKILRLSARSRRQVESKLHQNRRIAPNVGCLLGDGTVDRAIDSFLLAGTGPLRFEDFYEQLRAASEIPCLTELFSLR